MQSPWVPPAGRLDYREIAEAFEITAHEATKIAERIFNRFAVRVVSDGVVTTAEQTKLEKLAEVLLISLERYQGIVFHVKREYYRKAVAESLGDGSFSSEKASKLGSLRQLLGIADDLSLGMIEDFARSAYLELLRNVVGHGKLDVQSQRRLLELKRGLALSDDNSIQLIKNDSIALFGQAFANVLSDGIVSPEEESFLKWLRQETGLSDQEYKPFVDRLESVKVLATIRSGVVPTIKTKKILEGGELCHWECSCNLRYETPTQSRFATGELLITSKKIVFSSPSKNLSFAPWKVLSVELERFPVDHGS